MSQQDTKTNVLNQGGSLNETMNAATRVTINANTILQQPDITLDELKNLPAHQTTARAHSNTWLNMVWPSIIAVTADIIDYANTFDSSYQALLGLVDRLKGGDEAAKNEFQQVLKQVLVPALNDKRTKSAKVASDTASLKVKFLQDYNNFEHDYEEAQTAYTSNSGTLTGLQGKLQAAQAKEKSLLKALIGTAASAGALLIAGAIVDCVTEGAATPFLVAGGVAGAVADGVISDKYSDAVQEVSDLQVKIQQLQNQLNYLNAVNGQIKGFDECISDSVTAMQSVADGWTALKLDITKVIDQLHQITPQEAAIVITVHLDAASKDWKTVLQQATVLQPSGSIPMTNFKGMDSFLNAIKQKQGA